MIVGQGGDRRGAGSRERSFGVDQVELSELALAIADACDARGFLSRSKRRPGRRTRGTGSIRQIGFRGADVRLCVAKRGPALCLRALPLRPSQL